MPSTRWFVYILRCRDGSLYTGTARDIAKRIALHDCGKGAKYTASRGPVELVWQEGPMTVSRALRREHQLKQLTRTQKLALIRGDLVLKLPRRKILSRSRGLEP
jgi:predicted GIY-YIG superfamily endonuclease